MESSLSIVIYIHICIFTWCRPDRYRDHLRIYITLITMEETNGEIFLRTCNKHEDMGEHIVNPTLEGEGDMTCQYFGTGL